MTGLFIPWSQKLQARAHFLNIANTRKIGENAKNRGMKKKYSKNHNSINNHCRDLWLVPFGRKKLALPQV